MRTLLVLAALSLAACAPGANPITPSADMDAFPTFSVVSPLGDHACIKASELSGDLIFDIAVSDAGSRGIDRFETLVAHSDQAGCWATYDNTQLEALSVMAGPSRYLPNAGYAGPSRFVWPIRTFSCGHAWLVITAKPTDAVILSRAVNYGVDCPR